jgi:hypothetical protein
VSSASQTLKKSHRQKIFLFTLLISSRNLALKYFI